MLQAGRSPVRVPDEVDFFSLPNPSSRTTALGSTQPLTEISTRNLPGGKMRPAHRADNLAVIYEPLATLRAFTACTGLTLPYPRTFLIFDRFVNEIKNKRITPLVDTIYVNAVKIFVRY
jgi:hypothetical protein